MKLSHGTIERNVTILAALSLAVVTIGGIVEIVPLFYVENTIEKVEGVRPYTPLELAGRNIYVREGCYVCHSQQVRPFRDEVERYGHYSLAAESLYDRPFQWGSKRTGPDLARVGGKYTNQWHAAHMTDPRAVVPESIMPGYPALARTELGFLQYSFIETVEAMHPYYVIRALGGVLFLAGALVMVYNLWRTARGDVRAEAPYVGARAPAVG